MPFHAIEKKAEDLIIAKHRLDDPTLVFSFWRTFLNVNYMNKTSVRNLKWNERMHSYVKVVSNEVMIELLEHNESKIMKRLYNNFANNQLIPISKNEKVIQLYWILQVNITQRNNKFKNEFNLEMLKNQFMVKISWNLRNIIVKCEHFVGVLCYHQLSFISKQK